LSHHSNYDEFAIEFVSELRILYEFHIKAPWWTRVI